jgi:hypothetical protein
VSMRVEGAEAPAMLLAAKATMGARTTCLMLTVIEEGGNRWRYNLSGQQNSRVTYGKVLVPGTWSPCAGPLRSALAGTSPAASSAA